MEIRIERVYDDASVADGFRVLVDRLWPRGLSKERAALGLYRKLLQAVGESSVYLEEYARTQIGAEEMHLLEMNKLLRDYTIK